MATSKETGLIERLNLAADEVDTIATLEGSIQNRKFVSNNESKMISIKQKLQCEARRRMLRAQIDALPTDQEIEHTKNSSPKSIQNFISMKIFAELLKTNKSEPFGSLEISTIIDYIRIKRDKFHKLLAMHYYDAAGKGYLTIEDLSEYLIEEVLPHIPTLASFLDAHSLHELYICVVTRKFCFFIDPMRHNKMRIIDIIASRFLEEIQEVNATEKSEEDGKSSETQQEQTNTIDTPNWSAFYHNYYDNFLKVRNLYSQLDTDGNGLLSVEELTDFMRMTNTFIQRVFEVQQTYENNELDLRGFCDLLLAADNKSERTALNYYFRVLDVDGDNMLGTNDLYYFYRDIAAMFEECLDDNSTEKAPLFDDIEHEIFDMCRPANPNGITLKELIACGSGDTIVGMLTDLDCFLDYENREGLVYEE